MTNHFLFLTSLVLAIAVPLAYGESSPAASPSFFVDTPSAAGPTSSAKTMNPTVSSRVPTTAPASSPVVESPAASPVNDLPVTCSDNDAFPFYVDATYGKQTCAWLRKVGTGVAFDALCSSKAPLGYGFVVCPETCGRC